MKNRWKTIACKIFLYFAISLFSFETYAQGTPTATNDQVLVFAGKSNQLRVLDNDVIPVGCASPVITIITAPTSGTAIVVGGYIQYTPNTLGNFSLSYRIACGANFSEASVSIKVVPKVDNISDASCVIEAPSTVWGIKEGQINKTDLVHNYGPLMVGDIDNDGIVDIVGFIPNTAAGDPKNTFESFGIKIFNYVNNKVAVKSSFLFAASSGASVPTMGAMAIARYNDEGYIVVAASDHHIYAYSPTGVRKWKTPFRPGVEFGSIVNIADFNNDGVPEVYTGNQIYSLATGALLCDGGSTNNTGILHNRSGHSTMAADIDGDGKLELCAGTQIYKVTITNDNGTVGNSIAVISDMELPTTTTISTTILHADYKDGATQVVDIDGDGKLEIVVISKAQVVFPLTDHRVRAYAWKPLPGNQSYLMGSYLVPARNVYYYSIPMLGNIDNEPNPEIIFTTNGTLKTTNAAPYLYRMYALKFNPLAARGSQLSLKWDLDHTDQSGCTGMTLFDFNLDGTSEIVYRDLTTLRIINGSGSAPNVLNTFQKVESGTLREFPVIADIDNDGQAEIIVTGWDGVVGVGVGVGASYVRVFKSNGSPWAPARKVWNQYAYNAVNINDDLTIPKTQLHPTTVFPGKDGQLGTAYDIRPYNNFMQQQTILNKNGTPLWLAPNVAIGIPVPTYNYHATGDSMVITLTINNTGDASLQKDVYITVYKDVVNTGSVKYTYAHPEDIAKGTSKVVTFAIPNFSTWIGLVDNNTKLIVKINDKGEAKDHQPVCETANTTHNKLYSNLLLANNDYTFTLENNPVTIDVLGNDSILTGCTPLISIVSQPANGTATLNSTNDSVVYTPNAGYVGHDTLSYQIKCNNDISIANVMLMVYKKPDNIVDPGFCNILMPSFDFKIKQQWQTVNAGYANTGPLVGDLDGDGLPEIIAYSPDLTAVNIYNGQSGVFISQIKFPAPSSFAATGGWVPHMTSILVDADKNGMAEIIGVNPATHEIYSYEVKVIGGVFSLTLKWKAPRQFQNPFTKDNLPHLNVADFNGDGVPELLIYNQIYNAVTGVYLGQTEPMATAHKGCDPGRITDWNQSSNFQTTADFDGDGYPEIVAGGKIYKVNFDAGKTAVTCSVLKSNAGVPDGFTAVADIDMDGNLDVVVASTSGNTVSLYVWSPLTTWMTKKEIYTSINNYPAHSFPFVGDIDGVDNTVTGKKHPEICIVTSKGAAGPYAGYVRAYKYNSSTKTMVDKWILGTSDISGGTGITLFDFNNDGINELVYRDQTHLRILNGVADGTPVLADPSAIFACASGTAFEYPVIADTDGDGSANICVTCSNGYGIAPHYLRVYESASQPWAPTRKVWNQVNYEPLQINEDLTVPKMAIPKNTSFNGKHPYNGALIQIPIVNSLFEPVILAPDPATAGMKLEAINATTLRVWFEVENKGSRFTNVNLPITLYHTSTIVANSLGTKTIGVSLAPGDKISLHWDIPSSLPYTKFIVRIQDDGTKYPADGSYLDCDYTNNLDSINVLLAVNDIRNTDKNTSLAIDVLANDFHGSCGRNALTAFDTIKNSGLHMGSLTISADNVFTYTPLANKTDVDSVDYYIKCIADSSAARMYILTNSPLSRQYAACPGAVVTMGFKAITGVQYNWYNAETGGTIVAGGTNVNTLTITKGSAADRITWWVEPVWKGIKFPRYRVDLLLSDNCGTINPIDCADEGTVIWSENFGGENLSHPVISPIGIGSKSEYIYTTDMASNPAGFWNDKYTIAKNITTAMGLNNWWHEIVDHTYENDPTRGYCFVVNGDSKKKVYEQDITSLCPDTKLYFSLWLANILLPTHPTGDKPDIEFVITNKTTGDTLSIYRTGETIVTENSLVWKLYGFPFDLPADVSDIVFKIYSYGNGGSGNDYAIDDIEIRICTPPINLNVGLDTAVCQGTKLDIISTYDEDCTFGDNLTYRWEFKSKNSNSWVNLKQEDVTVDCNGASPANRLTKTWTINSAEYTNEGYYRMLVSARGNIDKTNCRAASDSVYVRVLRAGNLPDIRVQFCPDTGAKLYLSSYIDTATYNFGGWSKVTVGSPNLISTVTGELNAADFLGTNIYKYVLKNQCGNYEGKLYLHTLSKTLLGLPPDTVAVCRELESSSHLHLNQIMGIGVDGDWKYDNTVNPDNTVWDNVTKIVAPHVNAGAYIFNASKAWDDAVGIAAYLVPGGYRGDMTAKMFKIRYTTAALSCVGTVVKETVIVVTDILVP